MKFKKEITLKNGKECLLRNASGDDARAVCEVMYLTHVQTDYLSAYPEEIISDENEERAYLASKEESPNEIELCAVVDGKIAGIANIVAISEKGKLRHRAKFGISIEQSFQGMGLGRILTKTCIECAREVGYAQLELNLVSDNASAGALYKSLGFTEFGRNPKGMFSRISGWQELILMRLELQ